MGNRYTIRKLASDCDKREAAQELCDLLREVDRREIHAVSDNVLQEINESIDGSDECWAAYEKNGRGLIVVFGIPKINVSTGRLIWCLGTYRVSNYWMAFAGTSRKIITGWANRYGVLHNAVGVFNTDAIRWLEWCGATMREPIQVGQEQFYPFEIRGGM